MEIYTMQHDVEFFKIHSSVVLPCLNWNTQSETSGTEQREIEFQTQLYNADKTIKRHSSDSFSGSLKLFSIFA